MKTALVLGGGGSRGSYQIGVWKAFRELGIRPDIITGTSVGALNGALIIQDSYNTALDLWKSLDTKAVFDFSGEPDLLAYTKAFFTQGGVCRTGLESIIKKHLREENIRTSTVSFGMVLTRKQDLSPHTVFANEVPNGMLCDYLLATTACFPATKSHTVAGVEYIDGGYCDNLPIAPAKKKGADKTIAVCLDESEILKNPFANDDSVTFIYPRWNLGNWLIFRKENTERNIRLGYLDAMKALGVLDGNFFAFQKNTFHKLCQKRPLSSSRLKQLLQARSLLPGTLSTEELFQKSAETTGKFLRISPYYIYSADSFFKEIHRKLNCRKESASTTKHPRNSEEKLATAFLSVFA